MIAASDETLAKSPIPEALLAQLLRCPPQAAPALVANLTDRMKARVALFCNARAHMRDVGHAIAVGCTPEALAWEGGHAGVLLARQAEVAATVVPQRMRIRISLAN